MMRLLVLLLVALAVSPAAAHKASDAYLTIERDGAALHGQWDIALRDLDGAIGLDANGDGDITWGEVRARHADIAAYAMERLSISSRGEPCRLAATGHAIDAHTDGAYAVLTFSGECAAYGPTLAIGYRLFAGVDPQHRGLLNLIENGRSRSVVLGGDAPERIVGGDTAGPWTQLAAYLN